MNLNFAERTHTGTEQCDARVPEAIGASRASLTTTMRLLTVMGLVRRCTRPGGRTAYYCVEDDAWEKVIRQRIAATAEFCAIADEGMRLLGGDSPRAARLREAYDVFDWIGRLLATPRRPLPRERSAVPSSRVPARKRP